MKKKIIAAVVVEAVVAAAAVAVPIIFSVAGVCGAEMNTTSASGSSTLSIAPAGRRSKMSPRALTMASASSSEKTPLTHAATYSPSE